MTGLWQGSRDLHSPMAKRTSLIWLEGTSAHTYTSNPDQAGDGDFVRVPGLLALSERL
jgi:hypothetical protein